ncbi:LacI family DNA-binding transcriptional regulator [Tropicimonas sediminicola]|uniref:Transcriptional regulator, LacI family n=1 Tax=Tropicimonas sediminicola TaxID=1031541 RepID=A0A239C9S2_9RHOB|nr:LacI family DNA-binding transcriptional regulator [Tropicimonas sediminicola]SNS16850.1 transcriptional regulator, LacI family [Tropicimonas sediminicola]
MDAETPEEPTLKDIAREAGVSVAAVSKVLNNREGVGAETRERISRIARDLGYRGRGGRGAARGLARATLVTLDRYVMNDAFYGAIIAGILSHGKAADIDISVSVVAGTEPRCLQQRFRDEPPTALVLVGIDQLELVSEAVAFGCPAVIVNGMDRTMRLPSVSPDYHFGAWTATRHLLSLGHRDIVHVTHPYRESIVRRVDGFRNALEEAGIGFSAERNLLDLGSPEMMTLAAGGAIGAYLDRRDRLPDALFCVNDIVALGAIQELQARGLSVPGDISIMGFDGLPIGAHSTPALTSMETDREALGRIAIQLLAERAEFPQRAVQRVTVGVHIEDRQSTGPRRG